VVIGRPELVELTVVRHDVIEAGTLVGIDRRLAGMSASALPWAVASEMLAHFS